MLCDEVFKGPSSICLYKAYIFSLVSLSTVLIGWYCLLLIINNDFLYNISNGDNVDGDDGDDGGGCDDMDEYVLQWLK